MFSNSIPTCWNSRIESRVKEIANPGNQAFAEHMKGANTSHAHLGIRGVPLLNRNLSWIV